MLFPAEIFASSIVLVGSFNPAIFTPDWLERHELIGASDAKYAREASSVLISRQVAVCETDWFALQVVENQFTLTSKEALTFAFRDLAEGICSLLPHTPISALGLNFLAHYKMATEQQYYEVGDRLAPKQFWNDLFDIESQAIGLADLTLRVQRMKRGEAPSNPDELRIAVQSSNKIRFGIFLSCNDHREQFATPQEGRGNGAGVAQIIGEDWDRSWKRSEEIFQGLLVRVLA